MLADLADRAAALAPPYEYGHTLTNRAGDFDQILHAMAEYMVNPDTATLAPFDYAMPEMAAVGWMAGGYEAEGPFGRGWYASTRVFLVWAPWWQVHSPYLLMTTPMKMVADGATVDEIPEHVSDCGLRSNRTMNDAIRGALPHADGALEGLLVSNIVVNS